MRISDWSSDVCSSDLQALPQGAHVGAVGADFEEQPGFGEGSPAPEVVVAQDADPPGDLAVEAADVLDLVIVHCLTLVRKLPAVTGTWPTGLQPGSEQQHPDVHVATARARHDVGAG